MRKLWLVLLFLVCAVSSRAQLVLVGGCVATATSCTPSTLGGHSFAAGQFEYTFAFRTATTAPTLATSYTALDTASASSSSFRSGCAVTTSSTPFNTAWTNATSVVTLIYSGTAATSTANCVTNGVGGHTSSGTSGTTSTYTFTTVTFTNSDTTSMLVAAVGSSAAVCTPATVLVAQETGTNIRGYDSNGAVASFATKTCTGTTGNWKSDTVELLAAAASAPTASPAGGSYTAAQSAPTLTSAGNTICYFQCTTAGCTATTPTVTTAGTCATGTSIASGSAVSTAINNSGQIKSLATATGVHFSAVTTSTYTLTLPTPTASPAGGSTYSAPLPVSLSSTGAAHFCYSTDGTTTPTSASDGSCTAGTLGSSFNLSTSGAVVKAIATASNWTNSAVLTTSAYSFTTWSKWNGVTVGGSTGNISKMNSVTIGQSTGNYEIFNGMLSPAATSTIAHVGTSSCTSVFASGTTASVSYSPTAGNTLVIGIGDPGGATVSSFSDNQSGVYTHNINAVGNANTQLDAFTKIGVASGVTTLTATMGSSGATVAICVSEYSGVVHIGNVGTDTTTFTGTTYSLAGTLTFANDWNVLMVSSADSNAQTPTATAGTVRANLSNAFNNGWIQDRTSASTGSLAVSGTVGANATAGVMGVIELENQ